MMKMARGNRARWKELYDKEENFVGVEGEGGQHGGIVSAPHFLLSMRQSEGKKTTEATSLALAFTFSTGQAACQGGRFSSLSSCPRPCQILIILLVRYHWV